MRKYFIIVSSVVLFKQLVYYKKKPYEISLNFLFCFKVTYCFPNLRIQYDKLKKYKRNYTPQMSVYGLPLSPFSPPSLFSRSNTSSCNQSFSWNSLASLLYRPSYYAKAKRCIDNELDLVTQYVLVPSIQMYPYHTIICMSCFKNELCHN